MESLSSPSPFEIRTVWHQDGRVLLLDQTLLPGREEVIEIDTAEAMWNAIKRLSVRGAPAIGVAAAYGVWVCAKNAVAAGEDPREAGLAACDYLATSRPTAVNLFWALDRVKAAINRFPGEGLALADRILQEADAIRNEDLASGHAIGRHGAELLASGDTILTHCNAGALATAGAGTALAPMFYAAHTQQKFLNVVADETRPLLQGSRLTAWELQKAGIPVTLICDNMAASLMAAGRIDKIIVGADRIAANGDFANKIGTYGLAVLARYHNVPFYVAAPWSTVDLQVATGREIPIEERSAHEITRWGDHVTAPEGIGIYNPAFDVTPAEFVTAFITDQGVLKSISSATHS